MIEHLYRLSSAIDEAHRQAVTDGKTDLAMELRKMQIQTNALWKYAVPDRIAEAGS